VNTLREKVICLRLSYAIKTCTKLAPNDKNKTTTVSPDYQFSKIVLIIHLQQAHQTQTMVVPENEVSRELSEQER
jgi:hypothetical protein